MYPCLPCAGSSNSGGQTLIQGIQKVVRRLSLEGSISEMRTLSQNYENVVLSADAESPVIYTDSVEVQTCDGGLQSVHVCFMHVCACVFECHHVFCTYRVADT